MITIHVYSEKSGVRTIDPAQLTKWDYSCDEKIWIDMYESGSADCERILSKVFGFHDLLIEDALKYSRDSEVHHPKIDDFESYMFIVFNGINKGATISKIKFFSLSCFLGHNFLVTIHNEKPVNSVAESVRNSLSPSSFRKGPDYLLHLIFDAIVDNYYPILDELEEKLNSIEETMFKSDPTNRVLVTILSLKRDLVKLIRYSSYQREVLFKLTRADSELISPEESIYYRNVYDHLVRIADSSESYRDYTTSVLDSYLSIVNNRLNETMKFLTSVATVMLPLTFLTGLFGMNFEHMPFLKSEWGFGLTILTMAAIGFGMIYWFRKKKIM
ncbi:MAG: magnesium/cobalt transporter CorA [Ignavibacteria bacterium]|nr:magnesium/cobalt transporter CorA [Ignavibacteria bacterium]